MIGSDGKFDSVNSWMDAKENFGQEGTCTCFDIGYHYTQSKQLEESHPERKVLKRQFPTRSQLLVAAFGQASRKILNVWYIWCTMTIKLTSWEST